MFLKSSLKCILFLGLFAANSLVANAQTDCDTLSILYENFGIKNKVTWKENTNDCCNLAEDYITCDNGRITEIKLGSMNLKGPIAKEIGNLTELTLLDLRFNQITDTIPNTIASNKKLKIFNVGGNKEITGNFPKELCNLTDLEELYLYSNKLSGSIPKCVGELSKLKELCLDDNQFTGVIPETIGNLKDLIHLDLEKNQLSGTIPESFSNLKNLEKFKTQGNKNLIGSVPEFEKVSECDLTNTDLCVKEGSKQNKCSEGLRKCTEDDIKKAKEYKETHANDSTGDENESNSDNQNDKKSGGSKAGIIILIIALVLLVLVAGIFLYRKFAKKDDDKDKEFHIPESMENIINEDYNHQSPKEKSFVVLSPKQEPAEEAPQLTLDESAFNYYDVSPRMREKHASNVSTGINQEQYEKQLQYQNLINNQNYYLS